MLIVIAAVPLVDLPIVLVRVPPKGIVLVLPSIHPPVDLDLAPPLVRVLDPVRKMLWDIEWNASNGTIGFTL